ncbi:hypothetical protein PISMIDRAFT_636878, partial [Pisolithus microcarpus 441]
MQPGRPPTAGRPSQPTSAKPAPTPPNEGSTRPVTRSSTLPLEDIINSSDEQVKDAQSGRKFLDGIQYTIPGEPTTAEQVSQALFYITQMKGVTPTIRSAIRSAAYLVLELSASTAAHAIVKEVSSKLEQTVVAAISPQIAKILSVADTLNDEAIDNLKVLAKTRPNLAPTPYRDALVSQHNEVTAETQAQLTMNIARAHAAIKERQILLDPERDHPLIKGNILKEDLVKLIKQALETLETNDGPKLQLKSLTRLQNQGIVIELNSQEATEWVRNPPNKFLFTEELGGKIRIKDRQYHIVVPFFPVSTDLTDPTTLREIESENDLPANAIGNAKWVKDPTKRS